MKGGGWHILVSGGGGDRYPTGTPTGKCRQITAMFTR